VYVLLAALAVLDRRVRSACICDHPVDNLNIFILFYVYARRDTQERKLTDSLPWSAQVRLEHMLARLRVLQGAATAAAPSRLAPGLYLSGAVEAASLHLLRHLGVTHILNATEVCRARLTTYLSYPCTCHA
jgi:hypothetical protein